MTSGNIIISKNDPHLIGWEEWCGLYDLGLPAIKAKIDTGAKTSCLHAFNIEIVKETGKQFVYFDIHPIQKSKKYVRRCVAEVSDHRYITNSGGFREKRYVIVTTISLGQLTWQIEVTLAKRDNMAFRMLLGREAIREAKVLVNPAKSCLHGKLRRSESIALYGK